MSAPSPLQIVEAALKEDCWTEDLTSNQLEVFLGLKAIDPAFNKSFFIVAKQKGVFSGKLWIESMAQATGCEIEAMCEEGEKLRPGQSVCRGRGPWKSCLSLERTLLNGLQAFCGIATATRMTVDKVESGWAELKFDLGDIPGVYHIRKIAPLVREFVLKAVVAGGGRLHRKDLSDRVLVKENHKYLLVEKGQSYPEFARFVMQFKKDALFEVESKAEALALTAIGAKFLLLDNFTPEQVRDTLGVLPKDCEIEISGGLNNETIKDYLIPGVNRLSLGALTHSFKALDLSFDWNPEK